MTTGHIWKDSFANPYADAWVGQATWSTVDPKILTVQPDGRSKPFPWLQVLNLSAPPSLHLLACSRGLPRAMACFVPWEDSGLGVITVAAADEALVVVMDLAGRNDLRELHTAGMENRAAVAVCTHSELEICPMSPIVGLAEAIAEASLHRRLPTTELTEAIEDMRWVLRTNALFPWLGIPTRTGDLKTLTLNVCRPL